jgi:hypothetical protein
MGVNSTNRCYIHHEMNYAKERAERSQPEAEGNAKRIPAVYRAATADRAEAENTEL